MSTSGRTRVKHKYCHHEPTKLLKMPVKYSSYSCGTMPNPKGNLVRVSDLAEYLEHTLDHDDYVRERIRELIEHCYSNDQVTR